MEEHSGLDSNLKTLKAQLKVVTSDGDTNESISKQLEDMKAEIATIEATLNPFLTSGAESLTEDQLQVAEKELKKWQQEWKRRKRACMDCASDVSEQFDMSKKAFVVERIGIDTDEDFNISCPT